MEITLPARRVTLRRSLSSRRAASAGLCYAWAPMRPQLKTPRSLGLALAVPLAWWCSVSCKGDGRETVIGTSQGIEQTPTEPLRAPVATDAGSDGAEDEEEEEEELEDAEVAPPPDISTLHGNTRKGPAPLGLTLDVAEKGPNMPWAVAIVNDGEEPVNLVADARLLWFEVVVPGKRQKVTCRLPEAQFPDVAEQRLTVTLQPGEGVVEAFDPRLYCFAGSGQRALVPGAVVTPYFGWKEQNKNRTVWQRGRRTRPAEEKPFVAERAPEAQEDEEAESTPAAADAGAGATADGNRALKRIAGQPFGLRSEYKEWSSTRLADDDKLRQHPGPLELRLTQGSDAQSERNATVSLSVKNRSPDKQTVFFRREHVSFEVVGPDGIVTCDPQPDARAPDIQAFSTLRKNGAIAATSRMIELCPQDTFRRPGLYLVHARFDATHTGEEFDLNGFTGRVVSLSPATVRIRTSETAFLYKQPMRTVPIVKGKSARAARSAASPAEE